jgi:hypothetical protein
VNVISPIAVRIVFRCFLELRHCPNKKKSKTKKTKTSEGYVAIEIYKEKYLFAKTKFLFLSFFKRKISREKLPCLFLSHISLLLFPFLPISSLRAPSLYHHKQQRGGSKSLSILRRTFAFVFSAYSFVSLRLMHVV